CAHAIHSARRRLRFLATSLSPVHITVWMGRGYQAHGCIGSVGFVLLDWAPARAKRGAMRSPVGVLCSGGLDSAVLLVDLARRTGQAVPVFVRAGHPWED